MTAKAKNEMSGFLDDWVSLPDYVHSIEAAWEIVESRKDYRRDIIILGSFERDGYCCRLADMIDGKLVVTEGHGDTAPRAICEAFLKMGNP